MNRRISLGARAMLCALAAYALVAAFAPVSSARASAAVAPTDREVAPVISEGSPSMDTAGASAAAGWAGREIGGLSPAVLELALGAATCAVESGAVKAATTLTVIDYSRPSTEPRLWVFDLATRTLLYEELVSHGEGTGGNRAVRFSNRPNSHQTSLGLFVTDNTYVGRNGYSLRMDGLEPGFNDRARERAIVMHGAPYVNTQITRELGRLGRSWGCPAVRTAVARELLDRVKGGGLVFSYYPDETWLKTSAFLGGCKAGAAAAVRAAQ